MATVDWHNRIVKYPAMAGADFSVDAVTFRNDMRTLEANEEGIGHPPILAPAQGNYTAPTIGPVAITVVMINGYALEFEDGLYQVTLTGGNLILTLVNNQVNVTQVLSQAYVAAPDQQDLIAKVDALAATIATLEPKIDRTDTNTLFVRDVAEGDVIPIPSNFKILDKTTKAVLVEKSVEIIDDLAHLTEV